MTAPLTARQRRVASLVADGRTSREIAAALGLPLGTVAAEVAAAFGAWGA